jgi:hypothetical protein
MTIIALDPPSLLTPDELAGRWSCAKGSLANMRSAGRGPAFVKVGTNVRYAMDDILAYEAAARVEPVA